MPGLVERVKTAIEIIDVSCDGLNPKPLYAVLTDSDCSAIARVAVETVHELTEVEERELMREKVAKAIYNSMTENDEYLLHYTYEHDAGRWCEIADAAMAALRGHDS
jgi:hypothetical protein